MSLLSTTADPPLFWGAISELFHILGAPLGGGDPPGIGHTLHGHLGSPGHHAGIPGRDDDGGCDGVRRAPHIWGEDQVLVGVEVGTPSLVSSSTGQWHRDLSPQDVGGQKATN